MGIKQMSPTRSKCTGIPVLVGTCPSQCREYQVNTHTHTHIHTHTNIGLKMSVFYCPYNENQWCPMFIVLDPIYFHCMGDNVCVNYTFKYFARDVAPSEKTKEVLMVTLAVFQQNAVDKKNGNFLVLARNSRSPRFLLKWLQFLLDWLIIFYHKS